jgi:hypothetical protein
MDLSKLFKRLALQAKIKSKVVNAIQTNPAYTSSATSAPKIKKTASEQAWENVKKGNTLQQNLSKPAPSLSQDQAKAAIKARMAMKSALQRVKEAERQRKLAEWQKQKPKPMAGSHLTNEDVIKAQNVARHPMVMQKSIVKGFDRMAPGFGERVRKQSEKFVKDAPHVAGFLESSAPFVPTGSIRKTTENAYGKMDVDDAYKSKRYLAGSMAGMGLQYATTGGVAAGSIHKGIMAARGAKAGKLGSQIASRAGADVISGLPINISDASGRSENAKDFAKHLAMNALLDVGVGGAMGIPEARRAVRAINIPNGVNPEKWAKLSDVDKKAVLKVLKKKAEESVSNAKVSTKVSMQGNVTKPSVKGYAPLENGANVLDGATIKTIDTKTSSLKPENVKPEYRATYNSFLSDVDDGIVGFVNKVDNNTAGVKDKYKIGLAKEKEGKRIKEITGIDVSGHTHTIGVNDVIHIKNRHGINGTHDKTMQNTNDIGRIRHVIDNYDNIEHVLGPNGEKKYTNAYLDKNMKPSPIIKYSKRVDGHVYVIEAVPDTKRNELRVLSAYMTTENKKVPRTVNANAPTLTSETAFVDTIDNTVPPKESKVNAATPIDESQAWKEAQKAGTYPGGTPKEVDGLKTRKGIDTAMRGDMSDEAKEIVKGDILAHEVGYTTRKQSDLLRVADQNVASNPQRTIDLIEGFQKTGGVGAKDSDIADGVALMKYARSINNPQLEAEAAETLSLMLTESGRTVAAGRMLLRATPQGRLKVVNKLAEKLTLRNRKTGKGGDVVLSKETQEAIMNANTPEAISEANLGAQTELWNQVPASWKEKFDSWRYMAMLGNPKTHIRNIVGNIMFAFPRTVKNAVATGLENVAVKTGKIDAADRTQALIPTREGVKYGYADFDKMKTTLRGQTAKFSDAARPQDSKIFNMKALEWLREKSGGALDVEDLWTMKPAYAKSIGRYMKAHGLKPSDMTGATLEKARTVASEEALRATYRDYTALGGWLSKLKNPDPDATIGRKMAGYTVDAIMPFTKTPVNIMRRGFDYSPFGLMKGVSRIFRAKTGQEAIKAIDDIAAGLTGTGIFGLGAFLHQQGVIELKLAGDDTGSYERDLGVKNYSLKVGDHYITLDWAVPMAMPFFLGAQASETVKDGLDISDAGTLLDASAKIFDPTMELSVMQGVSNALGSVKFKDSPGDMALALGMSVGTNYLSQYHPTLLKQVTRFTDPTQRSTRSTAENAAQRSVESFMMKTLGGIPGISKRNEPYIDKWGRDVKDERSLGMRAFETFLSPAYISKDKKTDVDREILRLNESLGDDEKASVIPKGLKGYELSLDGEKQRLAKGDLTTYNRIRGQESFKALEALVATDEYKNMTDSEKASAIAKAYKKAGKEAKAETLVDMGNDPWKVYTDDMNGNRKEMHTTAKDAGLDPKQYRDLFDTELQYADGKGNWSQYDAYQALEATDLSTEQKAAIWNAYNKTWKSNPYRDGYVPSPGKGGSGGRKKGKGRKRSGGRGRSAKVAKPKMSDSEKLFAKATSGHVDYRFKMPTNLSMPERRAILKLLKKKFNAM